MKYWEKEGAGCKAQHWDEAPMSIVGYRDEGAGSGMNLQGLLSSLKALVPKPAVRNTIADTGIASIQHLLRGLTVKS